MAPIAGWLSDRYPAGILGGVGLLILSAGMAVTALLPGDSTTAEIAGAMALCGAGFGFFQSPNLQGVDDERAASPRGSAASSIVAAARLLGRTCRLRLRVGRALSESVAGARTRIRAMARLRLLGARAA